MARTKRRTKRQTTTIGELAAAELQGDAAALAPELPSDDAPAAAAELQGDAAALAPELPSDDAPAAGQPAELPPLPEKTIPEVLDETGIAAAKLLAEHFGPIGVHVIVIVTDATTTHFSFRSATLGASTILGTLQRTYALAKRLYATF